MSADLTAWVTQTAPRALAYAITLVRNETVAEDLVQDCYQRLLARAGHYDLPADGEKLLFRSITNACINWTQRRRPWTPLDSAGDAAATGDGDPVQAAMAGELSQAVDAALAALPVKQRAVVELRALGHATDEIAGMLDTSEGNVRVLLHRGREQLADRLKPYLEEPEA
jgi:RNA polymerase sigma factor (sigma-70 family)